MRPGSSGVRRRSPASRSMCRHVVTSTELVSLPLLVRMDILYHASSAACARLTSPKFTRSQSVR